MIQSKRTEPKQEKQPTLEQIVKEQAKEISDLKQVIDDMILNGGTV